MWCRFASFPIQNESNEARASLSAASRSSTAASRADTTPHWLHFYQCDVDLQVSLFKMSSMNPALRCPPPLAAALPRREPILPPTGIISTNLELGFLYTQEEDAEARSTLHHPQCRW
jgi:hypothetical protein